MAPSQPKKTLIIHSGGIGDLLLALPAIRVFRRTFPESTLELMGRPERLSLIACDLQVKSIHSIDQAGMAYFFMEGEPLPSALSTFFSSFGVILVFGGASGKPLLENLKKAGVGRVILTPSFPPEGLEVHVADYLVESLRISGIEGESSFTPLRLPEDAMSLARGFLANFSWPLGHPQSHENPPSPPFSKGGLGGFGKYFISNLGLKEGERVLAIHPGSGSPAKNWDAQNFARVGDWFSERSKVILISGPARDGVEEVKRAMKKARPFVADSLPLLHLAAVLKSSTAYLGNDSGITHLAASLGLPTVALFGPTNPSMWGPRGPGVRLVYEKSFCSPCSAEDRAGCSRQCLKKIEGDRVLEILSPFCG